MKKLHIIERQNIHNSGFQSILGIDPFNTMEEAEGYIDNHIAEYGSGAVFRIKTLYVTK